MSRSRANGHGNGHQVRRGPERAVIAAVRLPRQRRWEVDESLAELGGLAVAAGAGVVHRVIQERAAPNPALYFGGTGPGGIARRDRRGHATRGSRICVRRMLLPDGSRNAESMP